MCVFLVDLNLPITLKVYGLHFSDLLAMLKRESEIRLSPEIQEQYRTKGYSEYINITEAVQSQVSKEFGLDKKLGTMILQCAETLAPVEEGKIGLQAVKDASFYRKYNR